LRSRDCGVSGEQLFVDRDAVVGGEAGVACQLVVRRDADRDHHEIGGNAFAMGQLHGLHLAIVAVTAFKTREPRTEMHPRALRHMPIAQVLCHARRQRALQGPLGRFDDIYLAPESACHGRQFETDKARTHHGDALRLPDSFAQGLRVGQGSQPEQALERGAGHIGPAHARPGGQHQVVVGECLAIAQAHAMCGAIDGLDAHGRQHLQAQALIEGRGPQKQPFGGDGALEECLRQRRALVGQAGLIAHHRDGSFMPGFAQRGRDLEAALTGADDDDARGHYTWRSGMLTTSVSMPGASTS
jgi:hypothetical protein